MKIRLELLLVLMIILVFISCRTSKTSVDVKPMESEMLYQQAIKALEAQTFMIEAQEVYLPNSQKTVRNSAGCYISMSGQRARINFTPDVFPRTPLKHLKIEDDNAEIKQAKVKKNGDLQYTMKIDGEEEWLRRKILITLYKNTNQCFVQLHNRSGELLLNFRGNIYAAE